MTAFGQMVLVVDDDADVRDFIGLVLESDLHTGVLAAEDGLDALEKLDGSVPALVVTDVLMPRLDGVELIQRLRASPATRPVPVLVVAASTEKRGEAMRAGASDYLDKPFDVCALVRKAEALLLT